MTFFITNNDKEILGFGETQKAAIEDAAKWLFEKVYSHDCEGGEESYLKQIRIRNQKDHDYYFADTISKTDIIEKLLNAEIKEGHTATMPIKLLESKKQFHFNNETDKSIFEWLNANGVTVLLDAKQIAWVKTIEKHPELANRQ